MSEVVTTVVKPVKVLHIITRLIVGGAQENTIYTALMLPEKQYRVDVISGPQTGSEGSLIQEFTAQGGNLRIVDNLVREISPINDLLALVKLIRIIKREKYSIVHTHSSKAGIIGRLAAYIAGVPVIVHTVHGWSFHSHMPVYTKALFVFLERWARKITDKMIVVTERDIEKGLRENIGSAKDYMLIRSAIPLDQFKPLDRKEINNYRQSLGIPQDVYVVGNVGRLSPQKNPLGWLKVAEKILKRVPDTFFLLVGDGPLRDDVEKYIRKSPLAGRVILTGIRRDVRQMLAIMDVFLITSLWEGLPRVIPQAMSVGIPVVATLADGTAEVIKDGETGFICNPQDIDCLAERCVSLIENQSLREEIVRNAMVLAHDEFDINSMVMAIDHLYQKLLGEKR